MLGYVVAMLFCSIKKIKIVQEMDLQSLLTIASFLFFAEVVSQTGFLSFIAGLLQTHITNPKLLVIAIMIITSLVAGIFSAGPAAAAMMPIIIQICSGSLHTQSHWIAVAYAAAICAGSSLFMWSATAGFILSGKVNDARIDVNGIQSTWGVREYLKYGLINYGVQISIALLIVSLVL